MAFQSKDGKRKFGSGFRAKKYDEFHPQETEQPKIKETESEPSESSAKSRVNASGFSKKSQPSTGDTSKTKAMNLGNSAPEHSENDQEPRTEADGESVSPEEVVAEHGPAHTVAVHHDHENGKHKVISHHKDGHMHESEHATAAEAHEHASKLGASEGGNSEPKNESEQGDPNADLSSLFSGGQ